MSIILVIIGLIVGGVFVGRDLIHNQKVQKVIQDIQQIKSSIAAFELKHDALPGDMVDAYSYWGASCATSAPACNGNGDRKITSTGSENRKAWRHMNLSGIYPGNYSGVFDPTYTPGVAVPEGPMKGTAYDIAVATWVGNNRENLQLIFYASSGGGGWSNSSLKPDDAYSIDMKMDNGAPLTGKIVAAAGYSSITLSSDPNCLTGSAYQLSHPEPSCRLEFVIEGGGVE